MMIKGKAYELEYTIWDIGQQEDIHRRGIFIFIKYEKQSPPPWAVTDSIETYRFHKLLSNGEFEEVLLFAGEFTIIRKLDDSEITFEMI